MKYILVLLIFVSFQSQAQRNVGGTYIGLGLMNKGYYLNAGYTGQEDERIAHLTFHASISIPLLSNENATVSSLVIGREITIPLGEYFYVTPLVGASYCKWDNFKKYDADNTGVTGIEHKDKIYPSFGIEVRKTIFTGTVNYSNTFYAGVGIKVILKTIFN